MSKSATKPYLSLYHYRSCPYCALTRSAVDKLGVDVELRDIQRHKGYRNELLKQGGKTQVPCLRIEQNGRVRWLYESADIIDYLNKYAKSSISAAAVSA